MNNIQQHVKLFFHDAQHSVPVIVDGFPGSFCDPDHKDHFPKEDPPAQAEERLVHEGANGQDFGLERVPFLANSSDLVTAAMAASLHPAWMNLFCWLPLLAWVRVIQAVRSYIKCVVEFCEKPGNERLWKILTCRSSTGHCFQDVM